MTKLICEIADEKSNTFCITGLPATRGETNFPYLDYFNIGTILQFSDLRFNRRKFELHLTHVHLTLVKGKVFLEIDGDLFINDKLIHFDQYFYISSEVMKQPSTGKTCLNMDVTMRDSFISFLCKQIHTPKNVTSLKSLKEEGDEKVTQKHDRTAKRKKASLSLEDARSGANSEEVNALIASGVSMFGGKKSRVNPSQTVQASITTPTDVTATKSKSHFSVSFSDTAGLSLLIKRYTPIQPKPNSGASQLEFTSQQIPLHTPTQG